MLDNMRSLMADCLPELNGGMERQDETLGKLNQSTFVTAFSSNLCDNVTRFLKTKKIKEFFLFDLNVNPKGIRNTY